MDYVGKRVYDSCYHGRLRVECQTLHDWGYVQQPCRADSYVLLFTRQAMPESRRPMPRLNTWATDKTPTTMVSHTSCSNHHISGI